MDILVIDAQGGGIGARLVAAIKQNFSEAFVTAVGTNRKNTQTMIVLSRPMRWILLSNGDRVLVFSFIAALPPGYRIAVIRQAEAMPAIMLSEKANSFKTGTRFPTAFRPIITRADTTMADSEGILVTSAK